MRIRTVLIGLIVGAAILSAGCRPGRGGRGGGPGTDSGPDIRIDSGPIEDRDTGPITIMDSGPRRDAGRPRDTGPTTMCPSEMIPPYPGTACSSATATCLGGCTDGACQQMCIESDPNPDCGLCINQNIISCANGMGCQRLWDEYSCCVMERCPEGSPDTCADSMCRTQFDSYVTCANGADCGSAITSCFP